jgi:hypothetical protein
MVRGEAGSLGARMQSQLAVNRAQVPIDSAGTEEESFGHLNVGQPPATSRRISISRALSPAG